jgi:hypothetical protein
MRGEDEVEDTRSRFSSFLRLVLSVLIFIVVAGAVFAQGFTPTTGVVNDSGVRMRATPDLQAASIEFLSKLDPVEISGRSNAKQKIGNTEDYWYKVRSPDGKEGWSFGGFIDLSPAPGASMIASCRCGDREKLRSDLGHFFGLDLGSIRVGSGEEVFVLPSFTDGTKEVESPVSGTFHPITEHNFTVTYSASVPPAERAALTDQIRSSTGFILTNARRVQLDLGDALSRLASAAGCNSAETMSALVGNTSEDVLLYVVQTISADRVDLGLEKALTLADGAGLSVHYDCSTGRGMFFRAIRLARTKNGGFEVDAKNPDHDFYQLDFENAQPDCGP